MGRDMQMKHLDAGKVLAKSSVAMAKTVTKTEVSGWFELEIWDMLAESTGCLEKGAEVVLSTVRIADPENSGQAERKEQSWQEFFDFSQWWDDKFHKDGRGESGSLVESGTYTMSTVLERGARVGVNKNTSSACGDVTTLCKAGQLKEALHILNQPDIVLDLNTYVLLLRECIKIEDLDMGKQVHTHIIRSRLKPNLFLLNTLVNMYAKCGSLVDARDVFDNMPERGVFTWTAMMAGYVKHGCGREALVIYQQMICEGMTPNKVTFICILKACASLGALEKGREVHAEIIKAGIMSYIKLENTLVNMYAKCGSMKDAHQVFDNMPERDVVSWNGMIAGYAQHGCSMKAFEMYERMIWERAVPDKVTFICVLYACATLSAQEKGEAVHADIIKAGIATDVILETALVDMYAKCGSMKDARQVFDNMAQRNVVSWSAMITGYVQHACGREALEIYEQMIQEGVMPNKVTFICVLKACASLAALEKGKEVYADIIKAGIVLDAMLHNALLNMYAKCGSMNDAHQVFDNMAKRSVVSWNAMIAGYGQHGCGREALQLYEQMQHEGLKPNRITFTCVLTACSHLGLVDEGCHYFDSMTQDHGVTPTLEHFGCMVDLLGRAGQLDEAEALVNKMPVEPDAPVWAALLGACRIHGKVKLAEHAAKCLLKWDPQHAMAIAAMEVVRKMQER